MMKAVLYSGDGKLGLVDVPKPELRDRLVPKKYREELLALPAQGQVLLRVEAASICGSDLHILEGRHPSAPPVVLGHEYVGRVVEVGSAVTHVRETQLALAGIEHCLHHRPRTTDRPRLRFYTVPGKAPGPSELTPTLLWVIISLAHVCRPASTGGGSASG